MSRWIKFPNVYEINTWVWLNDLSQKYQRPITLGIVPEKEFKNLSNCKFDAVWLMGVWKRSPRAREIAQGDTKDVRHLHKEFKYALPDYTPNDIVGSPFAILDYQVDEHLGENHELEEIRKRLKSLGLKLILDFVPNHLAVDHPWLSEYPEYFVKGSHEIPFKYFRDNAGRIFAHGSAHGEYSWTDTVQLDYRRTDTRERMNNILLNLAERCDGVRCDMAMLVTNQEFSRWGEEFDNPNVEFWAETIEEVKKNNSDFLFIGEVYEDPHRNTTLTYALQQQGFDYTYDGILYDRMVMRKFNPEEKDSLQIHLIGNFIDGNFDFRSRLACFIENHDRKRAKLLWSLKLNRALAALVLTLPGLHVIHQGQMEGNELKLPVQLGRRFREKPIPEIEFFYKKLLNALRHSVFHEGEWRMLDPKEVNAENLTYKNIIAFQWVRNEEMRLVVINLYSDIAEGVITLKMPGLAGHSWYLIDLLGDTKKFDNIGNIYKGDEILNNGLYLDLSAYGYHIYAFKLVE